MADEEAGPGYVAEPLKSPSEDLLARVFDRETICGKWGRPRNRKRLRVCQHGEIWIWKTSEGNWGKLGRAGRWRHRKEIGGLAGWLSDDKDAGSHEW